MSQPDQDNLHNIPRQAKHGNYHEMRVTLSLGDRVRHDLDAIHKALESGNRGAAREAGNDLRENLGQETPDLTNLRDRHHKNTTIVPAVSHMQPVASGPLPNRNILGL